MRTSLLPAASLLLPAAFLACGGGGQTGGSGGQTATPTTSVTTTSTDPGTTTASTTTTVTGPATDECKNKADATLVAMNDMIAVGVLCATTTNLQEPALRQCIQALGGDAGAKLSDGCAACFDASVLCIGAHCFQDCSTAPTGQACSDCRAANCDPALYACTGLPKPGACTNPADGPLLATHDIPGVAFTCAAQTLIQEPALLQCIQALGGDAGALLSQPCAQCFDAAVVCAATTCGAKCNPVLGGNPTSAACTDCRAQSCDPAFAACSGIMP